MKHLVTLLLLCLSWAVHAADAPRPNVLLICVDDLKPLLGCYGDKRIQSPNIDRLAARGVVFERAYCNQAVCAPSRNSLLTGVRPTTLGIYDLGTNFRQGSSNAVTLSQYFKQHGYRAEALGKIFHVGHGNHDGKLTREEFLANQPDPAEAPKRFERFDVNQDGILSREEFIHMGATPKS